MYFEYRQPKVFAAEQVVVAILRRVLQEILIRQRTYPDMINGDPISKPVITKRLQNDSQGKEMVTDFTNAQVVNRLKYERKQKREKVQHKANKR